ncbi:MAG: restriction endonuclease, partial [Clostridiaceae bacterium]|nr:restriction endonuclease [Clostridiaceae bacterium]
FVINWEDDGRDIRAYKKRPGGSRSGVSNYTYYFREAVTWSLISSSTFSIRYREPGSIHDVAGMSAFAKDQDDLFYILGLMGTKLSDHVLQMINPTINMQVGDFMRFPVLDMKDSSMVINLVKDNIALSKFDWNSFETSWDYMGNPLLNLDFYIDKLTNVVTDFKIPAWVVDLQQSNFLRDRVAAYKWLVNSVFDRVHANEITLNKIFIDLYGLTDELTPEISATDITVSRICDDWEKEASDITANPFVLTEEDVVKLFVSFTVGCMLGRYSPFNSDVQVVQKQNPEQEAFISITDEYYSDADLTGQFVKFIEQVLGAETLPQNVEYIGEILGQGKKEGRLAIRHYFLSNFYSDHVKMYKKRPIYWQFDSGKQNGFKALIYMQRWSADLIGDLRVSGVHWIQRIYENEIKNMDDLIEHSDSARERREAERRRTKLQKQLKETRDYDGKIGHLANERKEIDLDDGVKWNYKYVQTSMGDINLNILSKI